MPRKSSKEKSVLQTADQVLKDLAKVEAKRAAILASVSPEVMKVIELVQGKK